MKIKEQELRKLAEKRQETRYDNYGSIGDYNNGAYECGYISPYSISAHNVNTDVFVILQDWCSEEGFRPEVCKDTLALGHTPSVRTNINLKKFLEIYLNLYLKDTYATNLFPYIKKGAMSAKIPRKDYIRAAKDFTIPAIGIIKPKIAVCLGYDTFTAIKIACDFPSDASMEEAISSPFMLKETKIFCQAHTSQQGINKRNRGKINRVENDWKLMAQYLYQ